MPLVGRYVVWSAGVEVRVGRIADGSLVARTSTHETLTSLDCSVDDGCVVVAGRKDGRLLTMRLLPSDDQRLAETSARDADERRRILLHRPVGLQVVTKCSITSVLCVMYMCLMHYSFLHFLLHFVYELYCSLQIMTNKDKYNRYIYKWSK